MNRYLHTFVCLLLGSMLLALLGCSPTSPPVSYYSLAGVEPPAQVGGKPSRLAVQVGPVTLPDVLKKSQLVFSSSGGSFQLSDQHRWSGELDRDIARAIGEQLAVRMGTEQIALFPAGQYLELTHQVIVDVLAMGGVLGKEATLEARWSVVDPKTKTALFTRRSSVSNQPADTSHGAWVAAQRRNIAKLSEEIAAAITSAR